MASSYVSVEKNRTVHVPDHFSKWITEYFQNKTLCKEMFTKRKNLTNKVQKPEYEQLLIIPSVNNLYSQMLRFHVGAGRAIAEPLPKSRDLAA